MKIQCTAENNIQKCTKIGKMSAEMCILEEMSFTDVPADLQFPEWLRINPSSQETLGIVAVDVEQGLLTTLSTFNKLQLPVFFQESLGC